MPNTIHIHIRLMRHIGYADSENYVQEYWTDEGEQQYRINGELFDGYPLQAACPSAAYLLTNPTARWWLLYEWLKKEDLFMDDFMGGFCLEVDGAPWGYYNDQHTIGSTFDYLSYMKSWLETFPKNSHQPTKNALSIYGFRFAFKMIGTHLEIDFLGKNGKINQAEFLKFYPINMYPPILVDFYVFRNELWKAFARYEQLCKLLLAELQMAQFPPGSASVYHKNIEIIQNKIKITP